MASQIDQRDLLINMLCLESGIVPVSGVDMEHISKTVDSMSEPDRRTSIRKFRKLLKKAIRHEASTWHVPGTEAYLYRVDRLSRQAGLGKGFRGTAAKKLSFQQRTLRNTLIRRYLGTVVQINS
jgi:hypothetical protein